MSDEHSRLLDIFATLAPGERETLLAFAEFLTTRASPAGASPNATFVSQTAPEMSVVEHIPRPEQESVVAALKRLSLTYPMLDKNKLLTETSGLVTKHIMERREAAAVIDELETIFVAHYQAWRAENGRTE